MDECIHGMNPEWCAQCLNHKSPEEQEKEETKEFFKDIFNNFK